MKKSEETKRKILETTIETISEKGYASTTTKEIAENAGVSEGTIFKYYDSKQELLRNIVEKTIKEFLDYSLNEAIPEIFEDTGESSMQESLRELIKERTRFFRDHESAIQVIIQETMINQSVRAKFRKKVWEKMQGVSDRIFDEGKRNNEFKEVDNRLIRRVVFGSLFFQVIFEGMLGVNQNEGKRSQKEIEETMDLVLDGIGSERPDC